MGGIQTLQDLTVEGANPTVEKPLTRFELVTSPLPRECSTTELQGHVEGGPGWI